MGVKLLLSSGANSQLRSARSDSAEGTKGPFLPFSACLIFCMQRPPCFYSVTRSAQHNDGDQQHYNTRIPQAPRMTGSSPPFTQPDSNRIGQQKSGRQAQRPPDRCAECAQPRRSRAINKNASSPQQGHQPREPIQSDSARLAKLREAAILDKQEPAECEIGQRTRAQHEPPDQVRAGEFAQP